MRHFVLELDQVDDVALRGLANLAEAAGFRFSALWDLPLDEVNTIYGLHQECRKRQPPVETRQEPQEYRVWLRTWIFPPSETKLYHLLWEDGIPIAVSGLVATSTRGEFECGFTGTLPRYSGKGLALALKSNLILSAKEAGIGRLVTKTHPDNLAMETINRRLGFKPI